MAGLPGTAKTQDGKEWIRRHARPRTDGIAVLRVVAVCDRCARPRRRLRAGAAAAGKLAQIFPYGTPTVDVIKAVAPMSE